MLSTRSATSFDCTSHLSSATYTGPLIIPYRAKHMEQIIAQESQQFLGKWIQPGQSKTLENEYTFTGIYEGRVLICAGLLPAWSNRAIGWAYLDIEARRHMTFITKSIMRFLEICPFDRVETAVDCDFKEGNRWARMLGFDLEASCMKKFRVDGGDCSLYARIR